jgi:hypothetical protein
MFIEELIASKKDTPKQVGMTLDVEFTIRQHSGYNKREVFQTRTGVVFIGAPLECVEYIKQVRVRRALRTAERGLNPLLTR